MDDDFVFVTFLDFDTDNKEFGRKVLISKRTLKNNFMFKEKPSRSLPLCKTLLISCYYNEVFFIKESVEEIRELLK